MGCFLACFGISKKRKRRRLSNRVAAAAGGDYSRRGSYVALNSSSLALIGLDVPKKSERVRDQPKEVKIKKKVSFNLNVQIYEPISRGYEFLEGDLEDEVGKNKQEVPAKGRPPASASKRASTALASSVGRFPSNYRYQNVRDSFESYEEQEYASYKESDFDDDDDDDYYGDDDYCSDGDSSETDDPRMSQEGYSIPYAHSVLSPIENLIQWKAAKAKLVGTKEAKGECSIISRTKISIQQIQLQPVQTSVTTDAGPR